MVHSLLAFAGLAAAAIPAGLQAPSTAGFTNPTVHISKGGRAICVSGNVSVTASTSSNRRFNFSLPANQSQVTQTWLEYITSGGEFATQLIVGTQNVSGTFNISSTLCVPPLSEGSSNSSSTVQILTHGIAVDRSYWDFGPGYSYVDAAIDAGYSTFSYDRLGAGQSSTADPLNVVQGPLQVAIAYQLIQSLRNGTFAETTFDYVVGTGHSFGSEVTNSITAQYPTALDAAVLTGFSINSTAVTSFLLGVNVAIASENVPYRFAGLDNGYLVTGSTISNEIGFFRAPGFDPKVLSQTEATKATFTFGELFTVPLLASVAENYTGPVAIVNGNEDLPFCFGNCSYPTNKNVIALNALYPVASNTSDYLAPVTGHALNVHYSAGDSYAFINDFLKSNDL